MGGSGLLWIVFSESWATVTLDVNLVSWWRWILRGVSLGVGVVKRNCYTALTCEQQHFVHTHIYQFFRLD